MLDFFEMKRAVGIRLKFDVGAVMAFEDVLVKILDSFNRRAEFEVDVSVEGQRQKCIIGYNPLICDLFLFLKK